MAKNQKNIRKYNYPSTGLMAAIREDRLDGRTKEAKEFKQLSESLDQDFDGTATAILKRDIAVNETIMRRIAEYIAGATDKEQMQNWLQDMLRLQAATIKAITSHRAIQGEKPGNGGIVIDLEAD